MIDKIPGCRLSNYASSEISVLGFQTKRSSAEKRRPQKKATGMDPVYSSISGACLLQAKPNQRAVCLPGGKSSISFLESF